MRAAVIGIGSNSVRMLVAEAADGEIRRISRDRAGTRLFAGLDEAGNLSREAMASSCAAVKRMADFARSQGAEKVHLFATSATRDAANNADFAALLKAETGLTLEICSGDEEAALSFFGATDGGDSGVIDIGGGSTEIIIGQGMNIRCSFSCQMGGGAPVPADSDSRPRRFGHGGADCRRHSDRQAAGLPCAVDAGQLARHGRHVHDARRDGEGHLLDG